MTPLLLEVLDKCPTPMDQWAQAAPIGILGFLACLRWRLVAWAFLALAAFCAWATIESYRVPHLGASLWREGGWPYLLHSLGSVLSIVVLPWAGVVLGRRLRSAP